MFKNMRFLALCILLTALLPQGASASPFRGKYFDRVVFVLFENAYYEQAIQQPFFKQLAGKGVLFTGFNAITHPSQGNYVALTSGALNGVRGNGAYNLNVRNITDLLDARGISWKVYAEDFPGNCFTGSYKNAYARKHNPFISYMNVQGSPERCAKIVSGAQFDRDAATGSLPQYAFYIPNQKNDGHDTGVSYADKWYRKAFSRHFQNPALAKNTLFVTTFDESGGTHQNHIYTSFYGAMLKPGLQVSAPLDLYSLLRLVEDNWSLGTLGREDSRAKIIPDIWK
jgi:hypothetical protein